MNKIQSLYRNKLLILSMLPTLLILFFGYLTINEGRENLNNAKKLKQKAYELIAQFYEISYLQEERFSSLLYVLDKNSKNLNNLTQQYTIGYEYISKIEPIYIKQLPDIRTRTINLDIKTKELMSFYQEMISKLITKVSYSQNINNNFNFNNILQSYKIILELTENYNYQVSLLYDLHKSKWLNQDSILPLILINERIKSLKQDMIPILPTQLKGLFTKILTNKSIIALEQELDSVIWHRKLNISEEELFALEKGIKEQFFVLSNFTMSSIDDNAQSFYEDELNKLLSITLLISFVVLFILIFAFRLKEMIIKNVTDSMSELKKKNKEIQELHRYVDKYVILSKTDKKGNIVFASQAFCDISGYEKDELIGKPHNIVRHKETSPEVFKQMWEIILSGNVWNGEIKNQSKDKNTYWTNSTIGPNFDEDGDIVGFTSVRQNISSQKEAEFLNLRVTNLLNNANDGFLSFGKNMLIQKGYSQKSLKILSKERLENEYIADILFSNDISKKEIFELAMKKIIDSDDSDMIEILLTLLPSEHTINEITFLISYKIISEDEFMLILEDVSEKRLLQEKIEYENRIQKMIVVIATRKYEFLELKNAFFDFLIDIKDEIDLEKDISDNYTNITKALHTFKGLFAQEELVNITQSIHLLESKIINLYQKQILTNEMLLEILLKSDLKDSFNNDLDFIAEILGKDFLETNSILTIDEQKFKNFENEIINVFSQKRVNKKELKNLLTNFLNLNQKSLKNMLEIYPKRVSNIAQRLNKDIYPLEIVGEADIFVMGNYGNFIKSLVHVFRNMVDHGIESSQERVSLGKDEKGKILCEFDYLNKNSIQITISDDGRGLDLELIKQKAVDKFIVSQDEIELMSEEDIVKLIFKESFSTKKESDLISGRGIGLHAVLHELEKIGGEIKIDFTPKKGTKFIFIVPNTIDYIIEEFKAEKSLLDTITKAGVNFLTKSAKEGALTQNDSDIFNFYDYYSSIRLFNEEEEIICILSAQRELVDSIFKVFVEDELEYSEKVNLYQDVLDESFNTILGHSVSNFPSLYKDLEFSTPIILDKNIIEKMSINNKTLTMQIDSESGKMDIELIYIHNNKNI